MTPRESSDTWRHFLQPHLCSGLFDDGFMYKLAGEIWNPNEEDRKAANQLHRELTVRLATGELPYQHGVEKTVADCIHDLFKTTRKLCKDFPAATYFSTLAIHVLNTHVRPLTAQWHRKHKQRDIATDDDYIDFRVQLAALQVKLAAFARVLQHLACGSPIEADLNRLGSSTTACGHARGVSGVGDAGQGRR
ncbi:MAG: hypothetical protein Q8M07_27480 [Prosthecobacter sp.]|nr:hypothetical protein [Prosthecobacter sp.]